MAKITKKVEANIVWTDDLELKKQIENKKKSKIVFNMIECDYELHIRLEKKGRGGKNVTVIYNFPLGSDDYFKKIVKKLKRECGSGGTFKVLKDKTTCIEIQGEQKEKTKNFLVSLGFSVKFTGG